MAMTRATSKGLEPFRQLLITATFTSLFVLAAHAQDPPMRVADLNYISGDVSMQPAGADDWSPAVVNRPFTTGDNLWADDGARAELHLNNAVLRLGPQSSLGFLNLDDRIAQLRFSEGEFVLRVGRLDEDESFEVDTPNAAISILREGEYRFNADPDSVTTWVVVRRGEAEINGGGQAFTLRAGNSAQLSGTDQLAYDVQYAPDPDGLEGWCQDRDAHEARLQSARYLPPDVIGYQELDNYGTWRETPGYGAVWYPSVDAAWAPYRDGHWAWVEPWGWTWVDDAPWGFAPSHYGRWAYLNGGWGWVPGPLVVRGGGPPAVAAVYAPALVAFIGGGSWGVSLSIGGPAVGWVPLGPGEVYAPAYHMSPNYFRRVNVANTTVVNTVNITNVYNTVYVNRNVTNVSVNQRFANMTAPNAVTAVPQNAFASGRPVRQVGVAVPRTQVAQVQAAPIAVAPPVAPIRQSLAPMAGSRPAPRPPARAVSAPVVAKAPPPPPPVPFAAKQASLQQNLGRPVNIPAIRQSLPPARAVASAPAVRVAPPARQVVPPVHPAQAPPPPRTPAAPATPAYRPPAVQPAPAQPAQPNYPRPVQPSAPERPAYRPPSAQPAPAQPAQPNPRPVQPSTPERPAYRPPPQPAPQARPVPQPPANARPAEAPQRPGEPRPAQAGPPQKPSSKTTEKPKKDEKHEDRKQYY